MVPVSSACIYGPKLFVDKVGEIYPGRGGGQGVADLWCTFMEMGRTGLENVLRERLEVREHFLKEYSALAERHGERVLDTGGNGISFGITLNGFGKDSVGMIGSMLFTRCLTGARVVAKGGTKTIGGHVLEGFGSSTDRYHSNYLTAAVDGFIKRLDKVLKEVKKKDKKNKDKRDKEDEKNKEDNKEQKKGEDDKVQPKKTSQPAPQTSQKHANPTPPTPPTPNLKFTPTPYHKSLLRTITSSNLLPPTSPVGLFFNMSTFTTNLTKITKAFPQTTNHCIAMKANPLFPCLKTAKEHGWGIEVASTGELTAALKLGFEKEKIVYDSPAKTRPEIERALKLGVTVNADNMEELERINSLLDKVVEEDRPSIIGVRINPQLGSGTIKETGTASKTSKFGVPLSDKPKILEAFRKYSWLNSIHCHCGSQGCSLTFLISGASKTISLADEVNKTLGERRIKVVDIGGGMPVNYETDGDREGVDVTPESYCEGKKGGG